MLLRNTNRGQIFGVKAVGVEVERVCVPPHWELEHLQGTAHSLQSLTQICFIINLINSSVKFITLFLGKFCVTQTDLVLWLILAVQMENRFFAHFSPVTISSDSSSLYVSFFSYLRLKTLT